jgi:DHA3 family tetracycline resistance protein-like MFS transporter
MSARRVYLIHRLAFSFAFTLAAALNLVWQASIGLTPLQLVLIGTVLETAAFLGEIPTGVVADVYSRRLSVIVGVLLYGLGWMVEGAIPAFWAFLLSQVLWGTGATFISGAHSAWIADEVGEANVGPVYVRGAQAGQLGSLLAIPCAAVLGSIQLNLPILVGAVGFFAIAAFLIVAMPERNFRPAAREDRSTFGQMWHTFQGGVGTVRGQPVLVTILAIGAFFGMASEGIDRLATPHFLELGLPPMPLTFLEPVAWFPLMSFVGTVLAILATQLIARRVDTADHRLTSRVLTVLCAGQVAAVVGFGLAGDFWMALLVWWALGVCRRLLDPLYDAWLNQGIDSRYRATVLSMRGQVDAFGQIAGGPAIGLVGTWFSLRHALVAAGLILLPALPLFARAHGQARPAPAPAVDAPT